MGRVYKEKAMKPKTIDKILLILIAVICIGAIAAVIKGKLVLTALLCLTAMVVSVIRKKVEK